MSPITAFSYFLCNHNENRNNLTGDAYKHVEKKSTYTDFGLFRCFWLVFTFLSVFRSCSQFQLVRPLRSNEYLLEPGFLVQEKWLK